MLLRRVQELPAGPGWLYEVKWDGYRMQAIKEGGNVRLLSRNGADFTRRFQQVANAVAGLKPSILHLDGELVAIDSDGRPSFQRLQAGGSLPPGIQIQYYAFDLLHLGGQSQHYRKLIERRSELESILAASQVRFSQRLEGTRDDVISAVRQHGLEGVVAKRVGSFYEPGKRNGSWVKLPLKQEAKFIVGAFRQVDRVVILLVGQFAKGKFLFAGKVRYWLPSNTGTGFASTMEPLRARRCPFANLPTCKTDPFEEGVIPEEMQLFTWVTPQVVAQVKFIEWNRFGALRQPELVGFY